MKQLLLLVVCLIVFSFNGFGQEATITFNVNVTNIDTLSSDGIHIAGSFQNWDPESTDHILTNNGDGTHSISLTLPEGEIFYKFVNGTMWGNNEGSGATNGLGDCGIDDTQGGYNRAYTVISGNDETLYLFYNACSEDQFYSDQMTNIENLVAGFDISASPNPFQSIANISYVTPGNSEVTIKVYNTLGQVVRVFDEGPQAAGTYTIQWDGTSDTGAALPTGQYFYILAAEQGTIAKQLILVK